MSGVAIGYAPGEGGEPASTFDGLETAPIVLPGDKGTHYRLIARTLGSIREGSILLFHGLEVSKVVEKTFKGEAGFELDVFIFQPYDSLIKSQTRFWRSSPLRFSLNGGGLNASLAPFSTFLSGGIGLDPPAETEGAQSPADSQFSLYPSREAARAGLSGPSVPYDFIFDGTAGTLDEDSGVTLLGFQIGEVEKARLIFDDKTGKPRTRVTALLYPAHLDLPVTATASTQALRSATDAKLHKLLRLGYRARLEQSPPLVGNLSIALVQVNGAAPEDLVYQGANPRIPSVTGDAGIEEVASQANQVLSKINRIPIERIGEDLREVASRMRSLVASPKMEEGVAHLNSILGELDQTLAQVQPQIGPLLTKLNEAASQLADTATAARQLLGGEAGGQGEGLADAIGQLTQAARSVQALADYLSRHPEALIRGKRAP